MSNSTRSINCLLLAFSLGPLCGHAADGVLEISQACATSAQGCFTGDVGGAFPVEITQSGSYRLTSNLTLANAAHTAISASAVGVTIDLNGFTIGGPTICTGNPVSSCTPTGAGIGVGTAAEAVVKNGRIVGMGSYGVALGARSRVEDLHVTSTGLNGIFVGDQCVVTNSIVFGTGEIGIVAGFGSVVTDSTSTGNKLDGVVLASGSLQSVTATGNGRHGAQMFFGSFAHNDLGGNAVSSIIPGNAHASAGNSCPDGSCTRRGSRRFYLTKTGFNGAQALTACATGYHMANRWELLDPSNLDYDNLLGWRNGDNGFGMQAGAVGWIRTGWFSKTTHFPPGLANCGVWTSSSDLDWGTGASVESDPDNPPVWSQNLTNCDEARQVWCVED